MAERVGREAEHNEPRNRSRPKYLLPIALLSSVALIVFWGFYVLDHYVTGGAPHAHPTSALDRYLDFDPEQHHRRGQLARAAMIAAVLGIVITVVSIIVQLSADRYTGVARMFLRDRINIAVMALLRHRVRVRRVAEPRRSSATSCRAPRSRDDARDHRAGSC